MGHFSSLFRSFYIELLLQTDPLEACPESRRNSSVRCNYEDKFTQTVLLNGYTSNVNEKILHGCELLEQNIRSLENDNRVLKSALSTLLKLLLQEIDEQNRKIDNIIEMITQLEICDCCCSCNNGEDGGYSSFALPEEDMFQMSPLLACDEQNSAQSKG